MDTLTARHQVLKRANLSLFRAALRAAGTATRSELSERTGISSTTVRALLTELMACGEAESAGWEESSGGRRAERYRLSPGRYRCAAFCITGRQVRALVIDARGEIESQTDLAAPAGTLKGPSSPSWTSCRQGGRSAPSAWGCPAWWREAASGGRTRTAASCCTAAWGRPWRGGITSPWCWKTI